MKLFPEPYDRLRREAGVGTARAGAAVLGAWLVPGSLAALETYLQARLGGREVAVWRAFLSEAPSWLAFGGLTPVILWLGQRVPLDRRPLLPKAAAHAGFALLCGTVYALVAAVSWRMAAPSPTSLGFGRLVLSWYLSALPLMMLCYFGVLGAGRALHWFTRHRLAELETARLSAQLAEARLGALRMQLHPHFLFNSLNAVTVLLRDGENAAAERVLELLSALLRESLRSGGRHRIPLEEEMDFIRRYLEVERVRFPDRLATRFTVEPGVEGALVPALILQPLVENAVRHGIGRRAEAGRLEVTARRRDGRLELTVSDDGPGPAAGRPRVGRGEGGVGLRNIRDRLAALYGSEAGCELAAGPEGGAVARIILPYQPAEGGGGDAD